MVIGSVEQVPLLIAKRVVKSAKRLHEILLLVVVKVLYGAATVGSPRDVVDDVCDETLCVAIVMC